jgi:uncharacterized protein (UPF0305 family)
VKIKTRHEWIIGMMTGSRESGDESANAINIADACRELGSKKTRGELGQAFAGIVLTYSPKDLQRMRSNFVKKIENIDAALRDRLEETVTGHLHGTYQNVRLMHQQGVFSTLHEPVPDNTTAFFAMVSAQCSGEDDDARHRFLKFLLSGFCMLVQGLPGHPVGMPFPGGNQVESVDGVYYCPVRTKAGDVDAALCPFCPTLQTPEIGYLKPPVNAGRQRKQEFIKNCYDFHNFNG